MNLINTILILEDERDIRSILKVTLTDDNTRVIEASSSKEAKNLLLTNSVSLIILDWMLPEESGLSFLKSIRNSTSNNFIPVIMLTAKAEEDNVIKAFTTGADDYVTKPFSPKELKCRVASVLKRGIVINKDHEIFDGDLKISLNKHSVWHKESKLKLTPNSYKLLKYFITTPGKVHSREQLIDNVWGKNIYINNRSVDVLIRRLRKILKPFNMQNNIISVRSIGYLWSNNEKVS